MCHEYSQSAIISIECTIFPRIVFSNLEIVGNSNSYRKFQSFPNKLNFCGNNYSREETIQGQKLFAEIRYISSINAKNDLKKQISTFLKSKLKTQKSL